MNVSLSSSEHVLHHYTMESTIILWNIKSIPIEVVPESSNSSTDISAVPPSVQIDLASQQENTYNVNILYTKIFI